MERAVRCSLLALLVLGLCACGSSAIRISGEPPQWEIRTLTRDGQNLSVDFGLRNLNDQPLEMAHLELELRTDGERLVLINQTAGLVVPSRGRESLVVEETAALTGLDRLDRLASGDIRSLPWSLTGEIATAGGRDYRVRAEGYLYRVPGRPDQFR